tara:strand:+ start:250 stop:663 length:414 start_codon:yes stop_codon:yes gene_type:complete
MASTVFHNNTVNLNDIWYESHAHLIRMVALDLGQEDKIDHLMEKFLGKKQKVKKQKNPFLPKKAKSSYFVYCDIYRPQLIQKFKEKHPNKKVNIGEIAKVLGAQWKKLKNRSKYEKMAEKDKIRYEEEMQKYKETYG